MAWILATLLFLVALSASTADLTVKVVRKRSGKVFGKKVTSQSHGEVSYGRTLKIDKRKINREMVAEGWAWQYVQYDKSEELREAQKRAKKLKLGLWADAEPVAPWEFRRREAK
jgi:micrococcal nuclease